MAELFTFVKTYEVLQRYADEVQELYKSNLIKSDHLATEGLLNSVHTEVVRDGARVAVDMNLAEYWKYVEYDTRPHFPPPDAILKWITVRHIVPTPDAKGRIPTPKQLAFLIGRKISEVGTKGSYDLTNAVQEVNRRFERDLEDAITQDLGSATDAIIRTFAR